MIRLAELEEVGTLGGTESAIHAMNNKEEAVGYSQTASGANHALVGQRSHRPTVPLPSVSTTPFSRFKQTTPRCRTLQGTALGA